MSAQDLAAWLSQFVADGGKLQITTNGMVVLASNSLGYHYFSLMGYDDAAVNELIDTIIPFLC